MHLTWEVTVEGTKLTSDTGGKNNSVNLLAAKTSLEFEACMWGGEVENINKNTLLKRQSCTYYNILCLSTVKT